MSLLPLLSGLLTLTPSALSLSLPRSTSITPPQGCPLPAWTVSNLAWYNGSSSLDCIHNPTDIAAKGCLCGRSWCEPNQETCAGIGSWVNVCYTGMPNYEPWGYGPPQTLDIDFADGLDCHDEYIGYRIHDIGYGESNCGYSDRALGRIVSFYGTSNEESSVGRLEYVLGSGHALVCEDGRKITYSGATEFELDCVHDAQFNATCTAGPFDVPVLSYEFVN
ncbi:hypothetical protein BJY04DRAFT_218348 [Aspergillus karnatakaensis]|uniref:uncharacterized protein n=1 Tax=Aspergillus karnatakaensis TaxID=1810916 RepID=UPI003CCDFD95